MITWTDVQNIAPNDSAIQALTSGNGAIFVTLAYAQMNATAWGAQLDIGARYLAAHLFTIGSATGGAGGPVSSERVGDITRVRSVLQKTEWDATPYGKMYRTLMRGLLGRMWLVSGVPSPTIPANPNAFIP